MRCIDIRLGAPNYPGDEMRMTGRVESVEAGIVTVAIRGANSLGEHVTGTVEIELPSGPA